MKPTAALTFLSILALSFILPILILILVSGCSQNPAAYAVTTTPGIPTITPSPTTARTPTPTVTFTPTATPEGGGSGNILVRLCREWNDCIQTAVSLTNSEVLNLDIPEFIIEDPLGNQSQQLILYYPVSEKRIILLECPETVYCEILGIYGTPFDEWIHVSQLSVDEDTKGAKINLIRVSPKTGELKFLQQPDEPTRQPTGAMSGFLSFGTIKFESDSHSLSIHDGNRTIIYEYTHFSPDRRKKFKLTSCKSNICRDLVMTNVDGSDEETLYVGLGGKIIINTNKRYEPVLFFTPDGKNVIFVAGKKLRMINLDDGSEKVLLTLLPGEYWRDFIVELP